MTRDGDGSRRRQGCGRQEDARALARAAEQAAVRMMEQGAWSAALDGTVVAALPDGQPGVGLSSARRWALGRPLAMPPPDKGVGGYDELGMVAHTVVRHQPDLLTDFEVRMLAIFEARWRIALAPDPEGMQRALEASGLLDCQGSGAILARGYEAFCRDLAERVLHEAPDRLVLNRCPRCARIVRTPRARQCLWCLHDWH